MPFIENSQHGTNISRAAPTVWSDQNLHNPHALADKRSRVRQMFSAIAPSYDLNNRLHSLWMDQYWRRQAVRLALLKPTDRVLDVACGTGDLTLRFYKELSALRTVGDPLPQNPVIGLDFTYEMLPNARRKSAKKLGQIPFINGDAQALPLADASVDVVSIAFGIRNVQETSVALAEFRRVLRPGGRVIILEFSLPKNRLLRSLYNFYFRQILPRSATLISGDTTGAYKYLPQSVNTYISPERMLALLAETGFDQVQQFPMTLGTCICYRGVVK